MAPSDKKQRRKTLAVVVDATDFMTKAIIVVSSIALTVLICVQVLFRYIFHRGVLGLEELALMVVVWLWFFGASYAISKDFYISSGAFTSEDNLLSRVIRPLYSISGIILMLVFGYLLFRYCEFLVVRSVRSVALGIPLIDYIWGVEVAFAFMLFRLILELFQRIRDVRRGGQRSEVEER